MIINYAASMHFWITQRNREPKNIPYPRVLIMADNKSSESWATKGCKRSLIGRRLGRLQCTMMMNNPVGLDTGHVDTKANIIADKISRWKSQTDTLLGFDVLKQEFKQLKKLSAFSSIQRTNLLSIGRLVIGQANKSLGSKGATTKVSRQSCFIKSFL